jgi:hypothetical protein
MSSQSNSNSQFLGNLQTQGYVGKDGAANAAADAYGAGVSALYTGLATAAGEAGYLGGTLPGPIGIVGNLVTLTVGLATAGNVCNVVGAVAGTVGGLAGGGRCHWDAIWTGRAAGSCDRAGARSTKGRHGSVPNRGRLR